MMESVALKMITPCDLNWIFFFNFLENG